MQQIIAMGGGGFSMEPDNPALDLYIMQQARRPRPTVCFLGQASGESYEYMVNFYRAFSDLNCTPSHLSLFKPHVSDLARYLKSKDIIYVGGGNTKSMLALWREWHLDEILREACTDGTVLAGISAGAICWFEQGLTDSIPGQQTALPCLGYLKGSCSPHYDGEAERRPAMQRMVASGEMMAGHAFDDGAAGHFIDGELHKVVSSRPNAKGYYIEQRDTAAHETPLETHYLYGG